MLFILVNGNGEEFPSYVIASPLTVSNKEAAERAFEEENPELDLDDGFGWKPINPRENLLVFKFD